MVPVVIARPTRLWIVKYRHREATMMSAYFSIDAAETAKAELLIMAGSGAPLGDVELWACRVLS